MLLLKLLIAWCAWFQTSSSLLSPVVLLALANIQNQRARATMNAWNWRARNQYNLALAKSRASLPPSLNPNLPAFGPLNTPAFRNLNSPALRNPLLSRTTREISPDEDVMPTVETVSLGGGRESGDDRHMDMLVPIDDNGEFLSLSDPNLGAPHSFSASAEKSANPEPHLHLYKHPIHHHVYHHVYEPPYSQLTPLHYGPSPPAAFAPPPSGGFDHHHLPSHPPLPTGHSHQAVNVNVVQNLARQRFRGAESNLGQSPMREAVIRDREHKERLLDGQHRTQNADVEKPEKTKFEFDEEDERNHAHGDKTLGTFNLFHSDSYDYPYYQDPHNFDPTRPENRQAIAKFIQDQQKSIDKIVRSLSKKNYHYKPPSSPSYIPTPYAVNTDEQEDDYDSREEDERSSFSKKGRQEAREANRIGAINTAELNQFPTTLAANEQTLPESPKWSTHQNLESRQQMIADYFETEQKNVQLAMEELQEEHQRNMEILLRNLNGDSDVSSRDSVTGMPLGSTNYLENDAEARNDEILTRFLQNDPGIEEITGITPPVGHIIQVPERSYSNYYQRQARSVDDSDKQNLRDLLNMQRNKLNSIEKGAEQDEDRMMIGHIGDSIIEDMQSRLGKTRNKRATKPKDFTRLITDPRERFDMPKTLENLGAIARTTFEDEHAPMYHMRNMVGSARDAVVATMKIPNQNFIVPTQYDIVQNAQDSVLGDINPSLFPTAGASSQSNARSGGIDGVSDTFQKVGSMIRGTVESGKEALSHVGSAANHAKKAIHSTKHTVPRVILKAIPQVLRQSRRKTMIFTPRIFDFSKDSQLQKSIGNRQSNFVRVGNILDAVGVSRSNPKLNIEKITIEPRQNFLGQEETMPTSSQTSPNFLDNITVEDVDDIERDADLVGSTMNNLQQVQDAYGTKSLKDFILRMKNELNTLMKNAKEKTLGGTNLFSDRSSRKRNSNGQLPSLSNRFQLASTNPAAKNETVGSSFIPVELTHPYMAQRSGPSTQQTMRGGNRNRVNAGPTVGAINPMIYERFFNERLPSGKQNENSRVNLKTEAEKEGVPPPSTVATIMKVQGQFLKPFMGQATSKNKHDFYGLFNSKDEQKGVSPESGYDYIELQSVNNKNDNE